MGTGPIRAAVEIAGLARSKAALEEAVAQFRTANGNYVLNSWEHFVTCTK
jgi:hypothetical protein